MENQNQVAIFSNEQFGEVRVKQTKDGEILFCLRDLCEPLGLRTNDVQKRLKDGYVTIVSIIDSLGRQQNTIFVTEAGMYRVILQSRKEEAEIFQDWICEDILPSIRKHGMYMTDDVWLTMMTDPTKFGEILIAYGKEKAEKQKALEVIEAQRPKVEYHDEVLNSEGLFTVTQIAKDFGLTAVKLNNILHSLGIQYKQSGQWLLYSEYLDKGYAYSQTVTYGEDSKYSKMNTKWTNKGRRFIWELLKENGIQPIGKEAISYLNEEII